MFQFKMAPGGGQSSRRGILECVHQELSEDDHQVRTISLSLSLSLSFCPFHSLLPIILYIVVPSVTHSRLLYCQDSSDKAGVDYTTLPVTLGTN